MTKRNQFNRPFALGALVISIIALAANLTTPVVRAQRGGDRHQVVNVLPPVGIALGQTLSVTFLNAGSNPLEVIPCVFDSDGARLKTGETLRLAPGQMRSLDLSRSEIGGRTESRLLVHAGLHADKSDLKNLVVAGEVIEDATRQEQPLCPWVRGTRRPPGLRPATRPARGPMMAEPWGEQMQQSRGHALEDLQHDCGDADDGEREVQRPNHSSLTESVGARMIHKLDKRQADPPG
jgi:hypothetical protein